MEDYPSGLRGRFWKPLGGSAARGFKSHILLWLVHWSSGLSRLPVTEEIVGSNPTWTVRWLGSSVGRAKDWSSLCRRFDSVPRHQAGGVAKWLNAAVCKTALSEFGGSNPPSSIIGISYNGSTSVSKTADVGSIPTIPVFNIMAELVKWLTHRFVDPACVGSNPTFRPSIGI